jgi:aspartyl-tRNA(Asn)/glutamyl-tRNA(Gln) amidotransferase subunit A
MKELCDLPIHTLNELIKEKKITSIDIIESTFKRIENDEDKIHAYVNICKEKAIEQAKNIDNKFTHPLTGIPIAVKDNICVKDWEITCCSKILKGYISPYDAYVIKKLKEVNAILIGTTNMDEFAMGSSTENSCYGPTHNPFDLDRVPGGSSGGSAAAVANGECIAALGSDTGGSIRQPASFCGVVGLKPTYGLVSRYGLIAFASSLDQIGVITKDVKDAAIMLSTIAGYDPSDSTSINVPIPDYFSSIDNFDIKEIKIGIPKEYFSSVSQEIKENIINIIKKLESYGAKCIDVSLPHTDYALSAYYIIAPSEASSNLARFSGVNFGFRIQKENVFEMIKETRNYGFGPEVKRRIMIGTYVLSKGYYDKYYVKALKVRNIIKKEFENVFKTCDFLITPTTPTTAFRIGEKIDDPISMYLSDVMTIPVNLAGLPAISIPAGVSKDNLPIGMQIIAKPLDEKNLLKIAHFCELLNLD